MTRIFISMEKFPFSLYDRAVRTIARFSIPARIFVEYRHSFAKASGTSPSIRASITTHGWSLEPSRVSNYGQRRKKRRRRRKTILLCTMTRRISRIPDTWVEGNAHSPIVLFIIQVTGRDYLIESARLPT